MKVRKKTKSLQRTSRFVFCGTDQIRTFFELKKKKIYVHFQFNAFHSYDPFRHKPLIRAFSLNHTRLIVFVSNENISPFLFFVKCLLYFVILMMFSNSIINKQKLIIKWKEKWTKNACFIGEKCLFIVRMKYKFVFAKQ